MMTTAQMIKALREAGLSQSEIGRRTGVPQPRISRWESGEGTEVHDGVLRIARLHDQVIRGASSEASPHVIDPHPARLKAGKRASVSSSARRSK